MIILSGRILMLMESKSDPWIEENGREERRRDEEKSNAMATFMARPPVFARHRCVSFDVSTGISGAQTGWTPQQFSRSFSAANLDFSEIRSPMQPFRA